MFHLFRRKKTAIPQNSSEEWRNQWRSLVPPECRNVPVTHNGKTIEAFILINHFAVMLQDGLLMEASFFDVCEHFMLAGYHVVWIMRCTQDIHNGYLQRGKSFDDGIHGENMCTDWKWKQPTTNFDHWLSDNRNATILLQHSPLPEGDLNGCDIPVLSRVTWAISDDPALLVPGRTRFQTVDLPASPHQLQRWVQGESLSKLEE